MRAMDSWSSSILTLCVSTITCQQSYRPHIQAYMWISIIDTSNDTCTCLERVRARERARAHTHTLVLFNDTHNINSHSHQGVRRGKEAASDHEERESEDDEEEMSSPGEESDDDYHGAASQRQSRYWTDEEHQKFLTGILKFGNSNDLEIAKFVGTRNRRQVATHKQKHFKKHGTL